MKKSTLGKIGIFASVAIAGVILYKRYKKEVKILREEEKKENAELEKLGLDPEYAKGEMIPEVDDGNLVKALFLSTYGNADFETESVEPDSILDDNYNSLVYVTQSEYETKSGKVEKKFDLHFEIPKISENTPRIGDFVVSGKKLANTLWEKLKFISQPYCTLCGYMVISYSEVENPTKESEKIQVVCRIPEFFYERYKTDTHDGLAEFVNAFYNKDEDAIESLRTNVKKWFRRPSSESIYNLNVVKLYLTYKISFQMVDPVSGIGMNLPMGVETLKYIVENYKVSSNKYRDWKGERPTVTYDRLIFNAPDENGKFNFLRYYNKDEEGHVVVNEFYWDPFFKED